MKQSSDTRANHKGVGKITGRQRVTMQDIARVAGCSQPTVSIVLNGNDSIKISDKTKARVLDAARELGYRPPGSRAQEQGAKPSQTAFFDGPVGIIVDNLAVSPEAVNAFDGMMQAVKTTGNIIILAETQNDPEREPKTIQWLLDQGVQAIIYACVFTRRVELPSLLHNANISVFLLNCYTDDLSYPSVVPGEVAGGHAATNALIRAGHRRIGIIVGETYQEGATSRLSGYRNALASADIPFEDDLVVEGNWLPSSGYNGTRKLMSLPQPPTAIFCQNDRMAVGCYEALKELGLSIPCDVSVIGYDDDELARHLSPPLTSMILPSRAQGRWVIEQLFHGPRNEARHPLTKLECELVERESIGPPKQTTTANGT
ncbi:MAG: LacI family DNA-binding transcriptional regulator [Paracoccaceae bacterium]